FELQCDERSASIGRTRAAAATDAARAVGAARSARAPGSARATRATAATGAAGATGARGRPVRLIGEAPAEIRVGGDRLRVVVGAVGVGVDVDVDVVVLVVLDDAGDEALEIGARDVRVAVEAHGVPALGLDDAHLDELADEARHLARLEVDEDAEASVL